MTGTDGEEDEGVDELSDIEEVEPEEEEEISDKPWSLIEVLESNTRWLKGLGFPDQQKPEGFSLEADHAFPLNINLLSDVELRNLSLRLTAIYSYAKDILSREASALGAFQDVYTARLGLRMSEARTARAGKATNKEELSAVAMSGDPMLKKAFKTLISRRDKVNRLTARTEIYKEQLIRLSREQTWREREYVATGRWGN